MNIVEYFQSIPAELAVIIISALPIAELRGGIPVALEVFEFSPLKAVPLALLGNIVPAIIIVYLLGPVRNMLSRLEIFRKFFDWLLERTRRKFYEKHRRFGDIALILFVAIPLPITGAWTGAVAAWLFGIRPTKAIPLILFGLIIASAIVTGLTMGVLSLF